MFRRQNRNRNFFGLCLNSIKHSSKVILRLHLLSRMTAFSWLNFTYHMTHVVFWDAYSFIILRIFNWRYANTRSQFFCHDILCGSHFRSTWMWFMKRRHAATLKLVKPIFDGCHRRRRVSVRSIQLFFDSAARFPFQKQESYIILPFLLTFCVCFHTRSKQNYDSNLTVILTVALRLILHDGKFFLS